MAVVEKHEELLALPAVSQKFNYLREAVEDDLEHLEGRLGSDIRQPTALSMDIKVISL